MTKPIISAIVAMSQNRVIGCNNQLPWHLPADLKHFKTITSGNPILMGRKTYESIGRPLPNRLNIVMTRDVSYNAPGCVVVSSIEEAIKAANHHESNEIFIIGGAEIYRQLLPVVERIYLTLVETVCEGDTYFPSLETMSWLEKERVHYEPDEQNKYGYSFCLLERSS